MSFTVDQIAEVVQGEVLGDGSLKLTGFAPADSAGDGDLTFAENAAYITIAEQGPAAAILVSGPYDSAHKTLIRVKNTRLAVARVLPQFHPPEPPPPPGVDPNAVIAASAEIDPTAHIGPGCVIGERVRIGARSVLMGGNAISRDCLIGEDVCLFPNAVLYPKSHIGNRVRIHSGTVIGSDGYGYVFAGDHHAKLLQVGTVEIHDDVEIGANSAIDRGAFGATTIGRGTKIDNLVHIAHNVTIGQHCLIMGQVGFAGSTHMDDYSVVASQSGVAGHLKLGKQITIGAKSGVMRDIPDGETVFGFPAVADKKAKRQMIAVQHLPDYIQRLRQLEKQVAALTAK